MSRADVLQAVQDYADQDEFRADLKANAQQAMLKRDYNLTELEREILRKIDWSWEESEVEAGRSWLRQREQVQWRANMQELSNRLDTYWYNKNQGQQVDAVAMLWI